MARYQLENLRAILPNSGILHPQLGDAELDPRCHLFDPRCHLFIYRYLTSLTPVNSQSRIDPITHVGVSPLQLSLLSIQTYTKVIAY